MMLFNSKTSKIKYFFTPPPKKRLSDRKGHDKATRTSVCLYQQPVTWIFTRPGLSNPFIENYYLIIVVFSCTHFSIDDIFYTKENTQISTKGTLTLNNHLLMNVPCDLLFIHTQKIMLCFSQLNYCNSYPYSVCKNAFCYQISYLN